MRQEELRKTLGVPRQTLLDWIDRGLPHARRKPPRGGRTTLEFDPRVVRQWLLETGLATTDAQPAGPILLTQAQVADHFGVNRRTFCEWLSAGCPGTRGAYDVAAIKAWREANRPEADPLLAGPQSDALEEYRRWKARREQFAYEKDQQQWLRKTEIHDGLMLMMGVIRQAVDTLQRKFGPEAREILAEAIDDAQALYDRTYAPPANRPAPPARNAR